MRRYRFIIQRFNPETDRRPTFREYDVEIREGGTVLEGLFYIHKYIDPTLAFRFSCRGSVCGSCAMNINNRYRLACESQAEWLGERIRIRPLNLPVIKDLVVDMDRFWRCYEAIRPYLVSNSNPGREHIMDPSERKRLDGLIECILCGLCFSACPITSLNDEYPGPHSLLKLHRFISDARDGSDRSDLMRQKRGIWSCRSAFSCQEVCPKGLSPARAINRMRFNIR
jgi:succinate dehydrogenase / fumarate reductase iron-sulfur subunit